MLNSPQRKKSTNDNLLEKEAFEKRSSINNESVFEEKQLPEYTPQDQRITKLIKENIEYGSEDLETEY